MGGKWSSGSVSREWRRPLRRRARRLPWIVLAVRARADAPDNLRTAHELDAPRQHLPYGQEQCHHIYDVVGSDDCLLRCARHRHHPLLAHGPQRVRRISGLYGQHRDHESPRHRPLAERAEPVHRHAEHSPIALARARLRRRRYRRQIRVRTDDDGRYGTW